MRAEYLNAEKAKIAFTLIEVLIVVMLFSVVILAVYGLASGGLNVYQRSQELGHKEKEVVLALERLAEDLRKIIPLEKLDADLVKDCRFEPKQISFFLYNRQGLQHLNYIFKDGKLHLVQTDIEKDEIQLERDLVTGIKKPSSYKLFQYLKYDSIEDIYEWVEQYKKEENNIPVAVKVKISYEPAHKGEDEEHTKNFTKRIFIRR